MKHTALLIAAISGIMFYISAFSANAEERDTVYVIDIMQDIDKSSLRRLTMGLRDAEACGADYIVLHLDTYGGAVDAADSMRTAILHTPVPVVAFIDMQAASAGALISIACDSIYMRPGASIGAATVVNQNGEVMPDKYQSFMRGMMRATAEAHGRRSDGTWHRDPAIAEKMVDTAGVLSFTPDEAIQARYCEGKAEALDEVIALMGLDDCVIVEQELSPLERFVLFMMSPLLQGIFLMMIIGGIYFEVQSPGLGLPSIIAILGAVLYFSPLYIHGLALNWEIALFVAGLILLAVEIFVTPGFGVAGITGIILALTGLIFAMVDNDVLYFQGRLNLDALLRPCAVVLVSTAAGLTLSIWGASKLYPRKAFSYIAQKTELRGDEGWVGVDTQSVSGLVGTEVRAATEMYPSGKVKIGDRLYEAVMEYGSANAGDILKVVRTEGGRLYCVRLPR
ncbi:MAG TPA: nodulation protein NfeD [Candidatus Coprenecus stercoravium]|uniref:Nodulation protein NfeD n=1 Tax=Candidatus Coprenecus stercoravium TaxID=2840735 RepID=A0A9D2K9M1_9BACT|nr:nodulation protein NfeD [Candidatus Coprenecus stercoravium]